MFLSVGIAVLVIFLFLGFNAFTDTRAPVYGFINAIITFACLGAIDTAINGREDSKVIRDQIVDVAAAVRLDTEKELRFFVTQIKMGTEVLRAKRKSDLLLNATDKSQSSSGSEAGSPRVQNDDAYRVRQNIARQLVLSDKVQIFDTTKIWTLVPNEYGMDDDADVEGNEEDDEQWMWEWSSTSTVASHSTQRSSRQGSVSGGPRSKSRHGLPPLCRLSAIRPYNHLPCGFIAYWYSLECLPLRIECVLLLESIFMFLRYPPRYPPTTIIICSVVSISYDRCISWPYLC